MALKPPIDTTHFGIVRPDREPLPVFYKDDPVRGCWLVWQGGLWRLSSETLHPKPISEYEEALREHQQSSTWVDVYHPDKECWHEPHEQFSGLNCRHCSAWFCL